MGLADGWVLDAETDQIRQVIQPTSNSLKFWTCQNQSYKLKENSAIALVESSDGVHLIKYI